MDEQKEGLKEAEATGADQPETEPEVAEVVEPQEDIVALKEQLEKERADKENYRKMALKYKTRSLAVQMALGLLNRKPAPTPAPTFEFPRKRHSHRCLRCGGPSVACYKSRCQLPHVVQTCRWCR